MSRRRLRLYAFALLIVLAAGIVYLWGEVDPIRLDAVLARRDALRARADAEPLLSLLAFMGVYIAVSCAALPLGPTMSLLAGFLFGRWVGTAAIMVGATVGAVAILLVARSALGERLKRRAGPLYERIAAELRADAFGYLIFLRLVPIFPFFVVNVAAGLFRVPVRTFVAATMLGRLPATFMYVSLGEEFGRLEAGGPVLSPATFATLTGIGFLALLPVALRARRRARERGAANRTN